MQDVIIIGGGIAGLSSAIFTSKAGLNTIIIDNGKSQINKVSKVQNIPGIKEGISGTEWIKRAKEQVEEIGGKIINDTVIEVTRKDNLFEVKAENNSLQAKYVIMATNANKALLNGLGFAEEKTNSLVPNGKIKSIQNIPWNGKTDIENLYLAGLITEIPSQLSVAMGHGASVGISVVSKEKGTPYMWHDV